MHDMNEAPENIIIMSPDLTEIPSTKDSGSICKQNTQFITLGKLKNIILISFFLYKYQFMDVYRTAT